MQISSEKVDMSHVKLKISILDSQIQEESQKKLKSLKDNSKIDGFRKGKAPMSLIDEKYGKAVRYEIVNELIQKTYIESIEKEKLNPVAPPQINSEESNFLQGDFTYEAIVPVYPEFEIKNLSKIKVSLPITEVSNDDIEKQIELVLENQKTFNVVDRESKEGDQINIDFVGSIDGVEFEGGKAEGFDVVIGSKSMIEGFEDGLIGLKKGDETVIDATFPAQYQQETLAGKKSQFKINVIEVSEKTTPQLDKEFVQKLGVESGDVEEFRQRISKDLETQCENNKSAFIKNQILDSFEDQYKDLIIPEGMIDKEIDQMINNFKGQMQMQGKGRMEDLDKMFKDKEPFKPEAKKRVVVGLVLAKIIEDNEIKLDENKLKDFVESQAKAYPEPEKFVEHYLENENNRKTIEPLVVEQQAIDFIVEKTKTKDEKFKLEELIEKVSQKK